MRLTLHSAALIACVLAGTPARAEEPPACPGRALTEGAELAHARAKRADDLVNSDGIFWRVEKGSLPTSFLFGTIGSTDEGALALARRASEEIPHAKVVATELAAPQNAGEKANNLRALIARALDLDHDTFDAAPPDDRAAIEAAFRQYRFRGDLAHHLQLWFLAMLRAIPPCEGTRTTLGLPEVDQFLAGQAKTAGVPVVALERREEQIDTLASIRPEAAALFLAVSGRKPEMNDDLYATLVHLYRESRPADIFAVTDAIPDLTEKEREAVDELNQRLLTAHNGVMAERLAPLLEQGGVFVAIGALHLSGKDGLIERLRAKGYAVTKVW